MVEVVTSITTAVCELIRADNQVSYLVKSYDLQYVLACVAFSNSRPDADEGSRFPYALTKRDATAKDRDEHSGWVANWRRALLPCSSPLRCASEMHSFGRTCGCRWRLTWPRIRRVVDGMRMRHPR